MATAIGVEACMQGKYVKFYKTATLVNELTDAKSNGTLLKLLKKLSKLDLLICDEWGYIPSDADGSQLLFQVIADCISFIFSKTSSVDVKFCDLTYSLSNSFGNFDINITLPWIFTNFYIYIIAKKELNYSSLHRIFYRLTCYTVSAVCIFFNLNFPTISFNISDC